MDTRITFYNTSPLVYTEGHPNHGDAIVYTYEGDLTNQIADHPADRFEIIEPDTGTVIARWSGYGYWQIEVGPNKGALRTYVEIEPVVHEHVILTALVVSTQDQRREAMDSLGRWINDARDSVTIGGQIESWWFAEDDRTDGSDCESAVFIPTEFDLSTQRSRTGLNQADARRILEAVELIMATDGMDLDQVVEVISNPDN